MGIPEYVGVGCSPLGKLILKQSGEHMDRTLTLLVTANLAIFCGPIIYTAAAEAPDAKASGIAQAMMQAMGGQDAWMRAHFVRFDFRVTAGGKVVVDRSHLWDKPLHTSHKICNAAYLFHKWLHISLPDINVPLLFYAPPKS